jgi:hypothetical protein
MNEPRNIEFTTDEAIAVMNAIDNIIDQKHKLAERLINNTNSRMAGFNTLDEANVLKVILERLEDTFAGSYSDEG